MFCVPLPGKLARLACRPSRENVKRLSKPIFAGKLVHASCRSTPKSNVVEALVADRSRLIARNLIPLTTSPAPTPLASLDPSNCDYPALVGGIGNVHEALAGATTSTMILGAATAERSEL
jgi:hypothetical protein